MSKCRVEHDHGGIERQKEGISSFTKLDTNLVFKELNLKKGDCFLDIGSGAGDYSFKAASIIGDSGFVYALERWEELVTKLNNKIGSENIKNMQPICSDITKKIPVPDNSIDVCLMALILHGFDLENYGKVLFSETKRILKPNGRLSIIEMKKEISSTTHPEHIRLSPLEIGTLIEKYNFRWLNYVDLQDFYIVQFGINK